MLLYACNHFMRCILCMAATMFIMTSTRHGEDNAKAEQDDTRYKEIDQLLFGLRPEYIIFFSNFYLVSHFLIVILSLCRYLYFCKVFTYLAIFHRSSGLICDPCAHIRFLPCVITWKIWPSVIPFKAYDL